MSGFRISSPNLDGHASAIGYLCMELATLEAGVDYFIQLLIPSIGRDAGYAIVANADLSQKVLMLKGLAFIHKTSNEWFVQVRNQLDKIESIQKNRNRFVHDVWLTSGDEPARWRKRVQFKKPQSFKPEQLITSETVPVGVEEIWAVTEKIVSVSLTLSWLFAKIIERQVSGVIQSAKNAKKQRGE